MYSLDVYGQITMTYV